MSITAMAGRIISVYRRTALVLDETVAIASMTLDRQPPTASCIEVTVSSGAGTVQVDGTVAGAPASEILSFSGGSPETTSTVAAFSAVSSLTISAGIVGSQVSAKSIGQDGSRNYSSYLVISGVRAHLNHGVAYWRSEIAGTAELQDVWFGIDYTSAWTPREGDVFKDENELTEWLVTGTPEYLGYSRRHHWEIRAKRRKGTLAP